MLPGEAEEYRRLVDQWDDGVDAVGPARVGRAQHPGARVLELAPPEDAEVVARAREVLRRPPRVALPQALLERLARERVDLRRRLAVLRLVDDDEGEAGVDGDGREPRFSPGALVGANGEGGLRPGEGGVGDRRGLLLLRRHGLGDAARRVAERR